MILYSFPASFLPFFPNLQLLSLFMLLFQLWAFVSFDLWLFILRTFENSTLFVEQCFSSFLFLYHIILDQLVLLRLNSAYRFLWSILQILSFMNLSFLLNLFLIFELLFHFLLQLYKARPSMILEPSVARQDTH